MKISIIAAVGADISKHKDPESKEPEGRLLLKQEGMYPHRYLHLKKPLMSTAKYRKAIGINNALPWCIPDDLKNFKRLTMGHPVIMGRKTFDSIGKPLPGRFNIVISRNKNLSLPCAVAHSLDEAIEIAKHQNPTEVFVIGGEQIYKKALPKADKMYITEVYILVKGDAMFPSFDISEWKETKRECHKSGATRFCFIERERCKNK